MRVNERGFAFGGITFRATGAGVNSEIYLPRGGYGLLPRTNTFATLYQHCTIDILLACTSATTTSAPSTG